MCIRDSHCAALMPGVPREMKAMWLEQVRPLLLARQNCTIHSHTLRVLDVYKRQALLHPKDSPDRTKNFLERLACGEQREWDMEYIHQQTGERRWFHVVAMGSEVEGQTKYILVLSDRTADRQVNQALSRCV